MVLTVVIAMCDVYTRWWIWFLVKVDKNLLWLNKNNITCLTFFK